MPIKVNLRHLEAHEVRLEGELPVEELDIDPHDRVIQLKTPLSYQIEVQQLEGSLLARGKLHIDLQCSCVRCLREFRYPVDLDPWTLLVPLEGEEAVPVTNDCVDLTPLVREDIVLALPQHPLCEKDCEGLLNSARNSEESAEPVDSGDSVWSELNKLKLKR